MNDGFQIQGSSAERYEQFVQPVMEPFVRELLDATHVDAGEAVLDVACGTGFVARAAATRVGPGGSVTGLDLNPAMLVTAHDVSSELSPAIRWVEGSAVALPFADQEFDAVVCQQGLQFVPDLGQAVAEATRVVARRGCVAATVWASQDHSPFMDAQYRAVERLLGPDGVAPLQRAFGCTPEQLADSFHAAGLEDVELREVVATVAIDDLATFTPAHLSALPWAGALDARRPDGLALVASWMVESLSPFIQPDGSATLPFVSHLAIGRR